MFFATGNNPPKRKPRHLCLREALLATAFFYPCLTAFPANFVVANTSDSGAGSLRSAMLDANANPGLDTIAFNIAGSGVHTIKPLSPLPALVDPVIIDGTTQPGYVGLPLIEISGTSAGPNSSFRLLGGNSLIRGLAINRFPQDGIRIEGPGTNVIQANQIGTDPAGTIQRANLQEGIIINGSWGNAIGGTNAGEGNLISGNGDAGVYLLNGGGNRILGNRIGTSATGANNLGNGNNGVSLYNSSGNLIGGESPGSRNIISGNRGSGIYLFGDASKSNVVQGNLIGTDITGKFRLSNAGDGITIFNASGNSIGGTAAAQGNLLSGNGLAGLYLNGVGASNNLVQGNLCGTDISGTTSLGNGLAGIVVLRALGNLIGGVNPAAANTISGNRESGVLLSTNSFENHILGNRIGVDSSGSRHLGNALNGISLQTASWNVIGSNVISGNSVYGCEIALGSSGNLLQGNLIGTDATGLIAVGNSNSGVRVDSPFNTIEGGNVISGNLHHGIILVGSLAQSNVVQGNFIGLDTSGTKALGNGSAGVAISGAPHNVIGASGRGNCISGNGDAGVYLYGAATVGNSVAGNRIGTVASGNIAAANALEGIYSLGASSNSIGGASESEGNLISGNHTRGLFFTNSSWNVIQGNLIGTSADGTLPLPNGFFGIEFEVNASNNRVGGSPETANLIAFSPPPYAGVRIRDGSIDNGVLCNSIFGNGGLGIDLGQVGMDAPDPCDADSGANRLQNYPVLSYVAVGQGLAIQGTLNSRANTDLLVQFYANPSCSPSGQGQLYLGQVSVHTDPQCHANFSITLPSFAPIGYFATTTATDSANNTSEFSPCQLVTATPSLTATATPNQQLRLSWPATAQGFILKSTGSLAPPVVWQPAGSAPVLTNGQYLVTVLLGTTNQFYLLSFE